MGTRVHKLRPIELETPSVTELREASDPEGLFFMDGEEELRGELRTQEAVQTKKRLEWLLTPPESLESAVDAITNGPHKNAEELAKLLRQMGFTVKLNSTVGGGLRNLRHTFLSIWTSGNLHGHGGYEVIVDPSFSEQFAVAHPTPRYTLIQSALPRVLVATPHRVLQAIMIMADELARAFKAHDIPLPPWRQLKSLISKYDAAESVDVLASLPAKPVGSAFASTRGYLAPAGGAAREAPAPSPAEELLLLASRFPNGGVVAPAAHGEVAAAKRAQQVKLRIANKLAQWGLEPAAQLAGASPTSVVVHDWSSDAGSPPTAALPTQQAHRVVQIGFHVNERVCWGCHECVCGARLRLGQARFWMQLSQSLAAWKGEAAHAPSRRVAASAA